MVAKAERKRSPGAMAFEEFAREPAPESLIRVRFLMPSKCDRFFEVVRYYSGEDRGVVEALIANQAASGKEIMEVTHYESTASETSPG